MFDEADAIRDELRNVHGVSVWDREKVWRTGQGAGYQQRGGDRRGGGRKPRMQLPACGHDYACGNEGDSTSGMAVADVDDLLADRLQAKFRRDFQTADAIQ